MHGSSHSFNTGCGNGFLAILISIAIHTALTSIVIALLWNWLIPELFGLAELSFLQAIGIACLLGLLRPASSDSAGD